MTKTKRKEYDFYATPKDAIENLLLNHLNLNYYGMEVLEPSAGNGNFLEVINSFYNKNIDCIEIREEEKQTLMGKCQNVVIGDFLELDINKKYDIIIGNPPYTHALEFTKKALKCLNDEGVLIFLLRTAFLESKKRYHFWQENPLSYLYTLSKRPSFVGKGTDATSYSWFIWDKKNKGQKIKII